MGVKYPQSEPSATDVKLKTHSLSRRTIFLVSFGAVLIILAIALGVGLGVGLKAGHNSSSNEANGLPAGNTTTPPTLPTNGSKWWNPKARTTWQIVLNETLGTNGFANVSVYDIDLFDTSMATINALHSAGIKVICYFSAGSYENWRPDANEFPISVLGNNVSEWAGERWLNISSNVVRNIMIQRIELARGKSCDGLDPDNIDGYNNDNGLGLTMEDSLNYVQFLADEGHARGMAVGLKNGGELVGNVVENMDWEVNEQCVVYNECPTFEPFITADKPVFHIEYSNTTDTASVQGWCRGSPSDFSTVVKNLDLDDWFVAC
jgi:hypothetical protein